MELINFVMENMLVLVPVLYIIGVIIKKTPKMPDWCIPYVLLVFGIALAIGIGGLNVDSVIQGILVTGMAVLTNQMIKQGKEGAHK